MKTRNRILLLATTLVATGTVPARAQDWPALLGCWESVGAAKKSLCVLPAGATAVDLVTIIKGYVVARERIDASGQRVETARGECTDWQSAEWSGNGTRLYLHSGDNCAAGNTQNGSGLIAMTEDGEWLYIQAVTFGGQTGLRVQRYREASHELLLPDEVARALPSDLVGTSVARAAAAVTLSDDDVVEALQHVDVAVVEAWLVERGQPFDLNASRMVALADAGVPSRVTDLMIALSYPKVFAINGTTRRGERLPPSTLTGGGPVYEVPPSSFCSTIYAFSSHVPYSCGGVYQPEYAFGIGYGMYPGPVVVQYVGPGGGERTHGRVVKGEGYRGGTGSGAGAMPRSGGAETPASTGAVSAGSASRPSSAGTSGATEQRTAKPRP